MNWKLLVTVGGASFAGMLMATEAAGSRFYIGTYTRKGSEGIYTTVLDPATGHLSEPVLASRATQPSFLALHPNGRFLYAVGERGDFRGRNEGSVAAFSVDRESGRLALLNEQGAGGTAPCHLVVDRSGRMLIVANYGSGTVGTLPIGTDGRLGERVQRIQHEGGGPNDRRQKGPHAHGVTLDASGSLALVCDLGIDRVMLYRISPTAAELVPHDPACAATPPGGGPRHAAFAPDGRHLFVLNELDSSVTTHAWDPVSGTPTALGTVSALPPGFAENNTAAEIAVHPNGRYVYTSNRGHDSIAVFAFDAATATLTLIQHQPSGGKVPRGFALDAAGRFMLVANQNSGNVVAYRIDPGTGRLTPAGSEISVPMAVCVIPATATQNP